MKRKCEDCDFEADDEEYVFKQFSDVILCGNCADAKGLKLKSKGL